MQLKTAQVLNGSDDVSDVDLADASVVQRQTLHVLIDGRGESLLQLLQIRVTNLLRDQMRPRLSGDQRRER